MIDYITLGGYRYRVLQESATPEIIKSGQYEVTLTGNLDYQIAPLLYRWSLALLVEQGDAQHGTLQQLRGLYDEGDPSLNKITFIDQLGGSHEVVFSGGIQEKNLSPYILDDCAYIVVPIVLERTT